MLVIICRLNQYGYISDFLVTIQLARLSLRGGVAVRRAPRPELVEGRYQRAAGSTRMMQRCNK